MTGMSTDSPIKLSMTHLRPKDKHLVHTQTTDSPLKNGPLPKETSTISVIKILMRKLLDSLELTRTPYHSHMLEETPTIQLTDGLTLHQALLPTLTREPPKISVTLTSMRKLSDSSELIKT